MTGPHASRGTRPIKGDHGREIIVTWVLYRCAGQ